jgi:hypothetical protein
MCIPFGAGYFAKLSAKKALWEMQPGPARHYRGLTPGEQAPPAANHNA